MARPTASCSPEDIAESTEPAPACCLDIEMAGEQSWLEVNAYVAKKPGVTQPLQIVAEKEEVHSKVCTN